MFLNTGKYQHWLTFLRVTYLTSHCWYIRVWISRKSSVISFMQPSRMLHSISDCTSHLCICNWIKSIGRMVNRVKKAWSANQI